MSGLAGGEATDQHGQRVSGQQERQGQLEGKRAVEERASLHRQAAAPHLHLFNQNPFGMYESPSSFIQKSGAAVFY